MKQPKTTPERFINQEFAHEDPGQDWNIRRRNRSVPFDILILCQDADWAERELTVDFAAELAAIIPEKRPIYRMRDGRFATLTNRIEATANCPYFIDIWNWWTHYLQPGLTDFEQSTQIDEMLDLRESLGTDMESETCH